MTNVLLPPFSSIPIPAYMRKELARRQRSYGLNYQTQNTDQNDYIGQMSTWIRVSSNGTNGKQDGFIFKGGTKFEDVYGVGKNLKTQIGLDYKGVPHVIENRIGEVNQFHRPCPGIDSVDVTIQKNVYRTAFIKWKCHSVEQLNYMTPYLMTPYTTVFLEWGWNNYNQSSLVPIGEYGNVAEFSKTGKIEKDGTGMLGFYTNPTLFEKSVEISEGRYEGMVGHIINYDFTFNPSQMCFDCTTEIASNSKFYFGLSMNNTVHEAEKSDDVFAQSATKKTVADYICKDIKSTIISQIFKANESGKNLSSPNKKSELDVRIESILMGRAFSPKLYRSITKESKTKVSVEDLYITFGCLTDIITEVIKFGRADFKIDISESKITAHPNIISCSENFLIPNSAAPYFSPESLIDSPDRPRLPEYSEQPIFKSDRPTKSNSEADVLLKQVLNVSVRQDISSIINHWRNLQKKSTEDYSFPNKNDPYTGNLSDIYLSYSFIESQMNSTPDLKCFLKSICEMLNENIPIWNLDVIDWYGNLSIRDMNYFNADELERSKTNLGLTDKDEIVYHFNPFVQNSIVNEFSFNVKLSDAVANMVINQANNHLSDDEQPGTPGVIVSQRISFPRIKDVILKQIEPKIGFDTTKSEKSDSNDKTSTSLRESPQNIDEKSMSFTLTSPDGKIKKVSRLILPGESGKSRVKQLLNDESIQFSQINTPPIPGVRVEFTVLGIAGFKTFQVIGVENLPEPYQRGKVVFQIVDVKHSINTEGWRTNVSAIIRPVKSLNIIQQ